MIAYTDGPGSPTVAPDVVAALAGLDDDRVLLGWSPDARGWFDSPALRGSTTMAGYALSQAVADGRLEYLPVRLSALPRLVADILRPEVTVIKGVRRGAGFAFATCVGWGPAAARAARRGVVVEVEPAGPDWGGPMIPGRIVATVERSEDEVSVVRSRPGPVELEIGRNVLSMLPDRPTLQFGPGAVAEAVLAAVDRPVQIWSGLVTEAVADLDARGCLDGTATAAYTTGGSRLADLVNRGKLRLTSVEETHDLSRVSAIDGFVGCNTAVQIGLDGSVNVERVGDRYVAGLGGHADFCAAAVRSLGGLSIIALRSTTRNGKSTIVRNVATVSTPRSDVEVVVTEHGVADLRGAGDHERARRIAAVAAPEHRAVLG